MDVVSGATRHWHESLMSLIRLADNHEGILHHPLAVADMERVLMTGLLVAQPNTYSHLLHSHAREEVRTPTETVIALIDMHPERDYTVVGLAGMVGVSVEPWRSSSGSRSAFRPVLICGIKVGAGAGRTHGHDRRK